MKEVNFLVLHYFQGGFLSNGPFSGSNDQNPGAVHTLPVSLKPS